MAQAFNLHATRSWRLDGRTIRRMRQKQAGVKRNSELWRKLHEFKTCWLAGLTTNKQKAELDGRFDATSGDVLRRTRRQLVVRQSRGKRTLIILYTDGDRPRALWSSHLSSQ